MAITLDQAIHVNEFHAGNCTCTIGKRGGRSYRVETWRRNGQTKLWVTRPNEFRVPVKYGLYGLKRYGYIACIGGQNTVLFHAAEDCPLRNIPADYSIPGTNTGEEPAFSQEDPAPMSEQEFAEYVDAVAPYGY